MPVTQQTVSLENYSQRLVLDELHIPPDLTFQVLIEDNFSEFVDILGGSGHKGQREDTTASDWAQQEVNSLTKASCPVLGLYNVTYNHHLRRKVRTKKVVNSPTTSKDSPVDTGEATLTRILEEAAEEAGNQAQARLEGTAGSNMIQGSSKSSTSKCRSSATIKNKTPPKRVYLEEDSDEESEGSEASTDSISSVEMPVHEAEDSPELKPAKSKKQQEETSVRKRAKPRHVQAGLMHHKYPILKVFATATADAARYPHKYRCRVGSVELSLMAKGPLEILHRSRTDAHLVKEDRIRMETPGLPLFDKKCNELSRMASKNAKERAKREYPVAPKLGDYYMRLGQQEQAEAVRAGDPSKKVLAQLNFLKIGLMHGGQIEIFVALWHDLVKETKTTEPIAQHDWRPYRVFVSICSVFYEESLIFFLTHMLFDFSGTRDICSASYFFLRGFH